MIPLPSFILSYEPQDRAHHVSTLYLASGSKVCASDTSLTAALLREVVKQWRGE